MHISEQLLNPSKRRLRLSNQRGVEHVVLDKRGTDLVSAARGGVAVWDAIKFLVEGLLPAADGAGDRGVRRLGPHLHGLRARLLAGAIAGSGRGVGTWAMMRTSQTQEPTA